MSKEKGSKRVIGLDIGFGYTKAFSDGLMVKFPSHIAYASADGHSEVEKVNIAGREYVIGRDAKYSQFRLEIPSVVELIKYAPIFAKYIFNMHGHFDILVTGLPPNCKGYMTAFNESIRSIIPNVSVIVLPQGVGILYDVAPQLKEDEVVIIDIGYNTVDCIVAEKMNGMWKKKVVQTLENFGIMKSVEIMRDILPESYGLVKNWSASRILETFEKGFLYLDGDKIDLSAYKTEATSRYSEVLFTKIKQELKDSFRDIAKVVVAGGGAYYVDKKAFGSNVLIPPQAEFSQARGYYQVGLTCS